MGSLPSKRKKLAHYTGYGILMAVIGAPLGAIIVMILASFLTFSRPRLGDIGFVIMFSLALIPIDIFYSAPVTMIIFPILRMISPSQTRTSLILNLCGAFISGFGWPAFLTYLDDRHGYDPIQKVILMGFAGALSALILMPWYFRATRQAAIDKTIW